MEENLLIGEGAQALPFFLLFMLSQWGWWCFFGKHSSANILFLPSLTACFQITFLVCAGIGGFLLYGTYGLFLFGIAYLLYAFVRKGHPLRMISAVEVLFLLCMTVLIYRTVDGKILSHADDFHHWGVVVKELLRVDCFPDKSRYLTMHFAYPLGSAVWIYHVCRSLSASSESVWMFAQALLMTYCILPLFAFFPKRLDRAASRIYAALYFLFIVIVENCILSYNVEIYTLLVDSLLPLVGVAASMFAFFADDSREMQKPKTEANILCLAAYLSALIQIKTSGVLFAIAAASILILKKSIRTDRRRLILTGGVLAASFVPLMLWKLYCAKHFAGMHAKHEGSISSFIWQFLDKSPADMENICYGSMKYFLTSSNLIEMVVVLAAVFMITMLLMNDSDIMIAAKCWMYMLVLYLVYSIFTTAMYVFSMPLREALYLASNFRYQKTMLIYCYYVLFATLLYAISKARFVVMRTDDGSQKTTAGGKGALRRIIAGGWTCLSVQPNEEKRMKSWIHRTQTVSMLIVLLLLIGGWRVIHRGRFTTMASGYGGYSLAERMRCEAALREAGVPDMAKCMTLASKRRGLEDTMLVLSLGTDRNSLKKIVVENKDQLKKADEALEDGWWILITDDEDGIIRSWLSQKNDPHIVSIKWN